VSLLLTATSPSVPRTFLTWWLLRLAVSDAIEGADVMLYGVSLAYKESSNCRLEANYA
jgi:hypothetical protein